jgi:beta-glucosidase
MDKRITYTYVRRCLNTPTLCALITLGSPLVAAAPVPADPDLRAAATERQMTDDERFSLLSSLMVKVFHTGLREPRVPSDLPAVAGYVPGIERLGIPPLLLADASLGLRDTGAPDSGATALPAGLALGSTFNPALAREAGQLVGEEARARGFNVALAGGINLVREVRSGRNFEYISEDPWLSGVMGAASINGIQSAGVLALLKHVSLNASETNKLWLDAVIDPAAHRESDLLAFEIGIEQSHPGALMCAYNKVNGEYACGNDAILNGVVKQAWGFPGWIMSDWKAVYSWDYALKGLDQQSGAQLDDKEWFNQPLREAVADGRVSRERLSDMVRRMLRSYYAVGIDQWKGPGPQPDMVKHQAIALEVARQGIVLLKNNGALPLSKKIASLAVIGGYAQVGVLSGDGSSQAKPVTGYAAEIPLRIHPLKGPSTMRFFPGSPLSALKSRMPTTHVEYDPGAYISEAVALAKASEAVVIFAIRHEGERYDSPDLSLPFGQDQLIEAIATANPNTTVVLQTGNPVAMPWHDKVNAIVQAWYPGQSGAEAIAEILSGEVNPSGRLPITFVQSVEQTPFPSLPGAELPLGTPLTVNYHEGAEVGYRWFFKTAQKPLFAFGHGLSYSRFEYSDFSLTGEQTLTAHFTVKNAGARAGADVPQLYLTDAAGEQRSRLLGFQRIELMPGESQTLSIEVDPRLLARYSDTEKTWKLRGGEYRVALSRAADEPVVVARSPLGARSFGH